jgi:hypothetical protein
MQAKVKRTLLITITASITVAILVIARLYFFNTLKEKIETRIQTLNKTGFNIKYDSITIDWRKNLIIFDNIVVEKDAYDTTCIYPEFIAAQQVKVRGFSLIPFLLKKKLVFKSIEITRPHIVIRQHSRFLQDSASHQENALDLSIDKVQITSAHLEYTDSTACKAITNFKASLSITSLSVDFYSGKPLAVALGELQLDSAQLHLPKQLYSLFVKKTTLNYPARTLQFDTLKILPHLSKLRFGRKKGYETDRIEGIVPYIRFSGLTFQYPDTFAIEARKIDIQMFLKIFRDKRLPEKKKFNVLPVQQLRKLPFGIKIDTLQVDKSYISYEEFAAQAKTPGTVFFDNLNATLYNINNTPGLTQGQTVIKANAAFMGEGKLEMVTSLPLDPDKNCITEGSLKDMMIEKINPMVEPMANMKVASGKLDNLEFKFAYNAVHSDGEVALNYHDLKIISYKDEEKLKKDLKKAEKKHKRRKKKSEADIKKDNLKSFIINAFVIRRNMDEKVPEEKRKGKISFYRDTSRSIFNYWWKSVFSGIKSAYNLDKLPLRKNGKKKNSG